MRVRLLLAVTLPVLLLATAFAAGQQAADEELLFNGDFSLGDKGWKPFNDLRFDTTCGGRSADPVGRSLWALARDHQVLCVTHLPQIAAYADAHFQIAKRERDGRTVTEITRLDREGRIVELAQMLSGSGGGTAAMASARELLDRAEAWRQRVGVAG